MNATSFRPSTEARARFMSAAWEAMETRQRFGVDSDRYLVARELTDALKSEWVALKELEAAE